MPVCPGLHKIPACVAPGSVAWRRCRAVWWLRRLLCEDSRAAWWSRVPLCWRRR